MSPTSSYISQTYLILSIFLQTACNFNNSHIILNMGKKIVKKKKVAKIDPLAYKKAYLMNVINLLDTCSKNNEANDLGAYFKSKADLNRQRLKDLG